MTTNELLDKLGVSEFTLKRLVKKVGLTMKDEWPAEDVLKISTQRNILREHLSKANIGKVRSAETKAKISTNLKGRTFSEEHRKNLSMSLKGRHLSKEQIEKIRIATTEHNKGRVLSPETKAKIAASLRGRKVENRKSTRERFLEENPNFDGVFLDDLRKQLRYLSVHFCDNDDRVKYVYYKKSKLAYFTKEDAASFKKWTGGSSMPEKEIADFLEQYITIERNNRKVISPKELDIYIPSKQVAVEFNGLYWHSSYNGTDKNDHFQKYQICRQKGIRLIQIFEDEWRTKKEIVKSILLSSIGVYERKFVARKCTVEQIDVKVANQFLEENHINGAVKTASKAFGLFNNDELLQVITVGRNRFTKEKKLELLRMATLKNTQVVGGFSKLLKDSGIEEIESYVDNRLFNAAGYEHSGWKVEASSGPSYFYTDFFVRRNRMAFMKQKLPAVENIEGGGTEEERAAALKWYRIYDCGTTKMKWHI